MSDATFVLMNCDLIAASVQIDCAGVTTLYCGTRRASELLAGSSTPFGEARRTNRSLDDAALAHPNRAMQTLPGGPASKI